MLLFLAIPLYAQEYELNTNWRCIPASKAKHEGAALSKPSFALTGWMPAVVPGTVLTNQLKNKQIPDPFYGMNNERIPDIAKVGRAYYTYWFVTDFKEQPAKDELVWLQFRGVNYSYIAYLNGHRLNDVPSSGMFLRTQYNITPWLAPDGRNRLAVIVYPPDSVGTPNGGQGGDGLIAHGVTNQYVAGWDWIQPIRDRNTGIWDKVLIRKSKKVLLENTRVITIVPGKRKVTGPQEPAIIKVTTELNNTDGSAPVSGTVQYEIDGKQVKTTVTVPAHTKQLFTLPPLTISDPKLWWPNGYGAQYLYNTKVQFVLNDGTIASSEPLSFGIREIGGIWNKHTKSREIQVNGQKIFIKGGNWILSDALLRFSKKRYDAEVRMQRDMNLNLIRVWGGGITERPEFYDACDKYGLLVMQDFWVSGDCNGRWYDPLKKDDSDVRKKYPDNHRLFLNAAADQVRMLRNHPSLALWCGGNEIRPPADILKPLRDSILPQLDGTRYFFEYSNDDSMSLDAHDGPYTIQHDYYFWEKRSWGFNSEIGSVGIGDYESLERFIPQKNMVMPHYDEEKHKWIADSVWQYHKFSSYDSSIEAIGHPKDVKDFARKAQLVNYNQYRTLIESFTAHMWDWYTGVIIWKTQNPWTAMVGQMYDVYLDPNAALFGLQEGAKPLHVMYDPIGESIIVANNSFDSIKARVDMHIIKGSLYSGSADITIAIDGETTVKGQSAATVARFSGAYNPIRAHAAGGGFLVLSLGVANTREYETNTYALPDSNGSFAWLNNFDPVLDFKATAKYLKPGTVEVTMSNKDLATLAFFNRISLIDKKTKKRILPAFCNNNYISILGGRSARVQIDYTPQPGVEPEVSIEGWNLARKVIEIKH